MTKSVHLGNRFYAIITTENTSASGVSELQQNYVIFRVRVYSVLSAIEIKHVHDEEDVNLYLGPSLLKSDYR